MQTGPRTSSAARRCSSLSPERMLSGSELLNRLLALHADPVRARRDGAESCDQLERVAALDEARQLCELLLEPGRVDVHRGRPPDLRMRGRGGVLAVGPQLLVQLLARAGAD